jgi:recombinational DNA repair protein RecR
MTEIKSLKSLVHELSRLPGVGEKSAQRLAYFLLRKGPAFTESLVKALQDVQAKVKLCSQCFAYTEMYRFVTFALTTNELQTLFVWLNLRQIFLKLIRRVFFMVTIMFYTARLLLLKAFNPKILKLKSLLGALKTLQESLQKSF